MRSNLAICISIMILLNVLSFSQVNAENIELIENGGFEDGMSPWVSYSYWTQCSMNATITDLDSYEGRFSIHTDTGQQGQNVIAEVIFDPSGAISTAPPQEVAMGWCVGGGAYQIVELDKVSDLQLSFWINLIGATEVTTGTDIAMVVWFWKDDAFRVLAYYMAWGSNVPIYKNFPQPTMSLGNITNILIHGTIPGKWNYVERQLEEDFAQAYPGEDISKFQKITVQLIGAGVRSGPAHVHAYWDNVSLTTESIAQEEPSPAPQPTTPSTTPQRSPRLPSEDETITTPTTTVTTTEKISEPSIDLSLNNILLAIFILLIVIIMALVLRRSKTSKHVTPPESRSPTTPETLPEEITQKEFCSNCGEPILGDSKFCMKCGTPKE